MITLVLTNTTLALLLLMCKQRHDKQVEYEKFCKMFYEE